MRFIIPSQTKLRRDIVTLPSVRPSHPCEHSRINILQWILTKLGTYLVLRRVWNPIDFQGQSHWVNFLPCNILVNTLESTSFNGFWPNLVHTVQLKRKTQSPCLIKDYRNVELTRSLCVYVDGPRNNMDMTDRTQCLHESITDCNYWNVHS
jgi:hypothetical protein